MDCVFLGEGLSYSAVEYLKLHNILSRIHFLNYIENYTVYNYQKHSKYFDIFGIQSVPYYSKRLPFIFEIP